MITPRLLVTAAVNLIAIVVALVVARRLLRRRNEGAARQATRMFALWWAAFAADTLLNTLTWLAAGAGIANELVVDLLSYPALTCIVLMIWGLMTYLAYLFTGRAGVFRPLAIFYAISWIAFVALVVYLRPVGVKLGPYAGDIAYATPPPAAATLWVALFFLLPPIVGAILYGTLAFRVKDRAHRYRIVAVSVGIFVWFVSSLLLTGIGPNGDFFALAGKALGLVCLGLFLSAYEPPSWLRARLGVHALDPAALPVIEQPAGAKARQDELRKRVLELV